MYYIVFSHYISARRYVHFFILAFLIEGFHLRGFDADVISMLCVSFPKYKKLQLCFSKGCAGTFTLGH